MGNVFRNSAVCNIQQAEEKNRSNLETTWKNDLQHVPKLRTYSLLKSNYIVEKLFQNLLDPRWLCSDAECFSFV